MEHHVVMSEFTNVFVNYYAEYPPPITYHRHYELQLCSLSIPGRPYECTVQYHAEWALIINDIAITHHGNQSNYVPIPFTNTLYGLMSSPRPSFLVFLLSLSLKLNFYALSDGQDPCTWNPDRFCSIAIGTYLVNRSYNSWRWDGFVMSELLDMIREPFPRPWEVLDGTCICRAVMQLIWKKWPGGSGNVPGTEVMVGICLLDVWGMDLSLKWTFWIFVKRQQGLSWKAQGIMCSRNECCYSSADIDLWTLWVRYSCSAGSNYPLTNFIGTIKKA